MDWLIILNKGLRRIGDTERESTLPPIRQVNITFINPMFTDKEIKKNSQILRTE